MTRGGTERCGTEGEGGGLEPASGADPPALIKSLKKLQESGTRVQGSHL